METSAPSSANPTAQIRRGRFALSSDNGTNSHFIEKSINLSSVSSSSSVTGSALPSLFYLHRGNYRTNNLFLTNRSHRFKEMDLEKMLTAMEKGHKVCKLLLLKKWEPSYKKLSFNRDTRQIILSKFDNTISRSCPNSASSSTSSKKQILDLRLVREAQTLHYKLNYIKINDKWKKDKDVQRFDSEMILVISYGLSFVSNHWILLCRATF